MLGKTRDAVYRKGSNGFHSSDPSAFNDQFYFHIVGSELARENETSG